MSNILSNWEWKYQIFFNENVEKDVRNFAEKLGKDEREIMEFQISFYKSFFTIDILLEALRNKELDKNDVIRHAVANISLCSRTEKSLYSVIKKDINCGCEKINSMVNDILEYSVKTHFTADYSEYLRNVFNDSDYEGIISLIHKKSEKSGSSEEFIESNFYELEELTEGTLIDEEITNIINNRTVNESFGVFNNKKYNAKVKQGPGYGEWWDAALYNEYAEDTLILYSNGDKIGYHDFIYTLAHEVYPGHAHFFRSVATINKDIDLGALLLIEGYATYSEMNFMNSEYKRSLEKQYVQIVLSALKMKSYKLKEEHTRMINQKIGYLESYYFGCFAIEYFINSKFGTVKDFLIFLNNNTKGEFFKLW